MNGQELKKAVDNIQISIDAENRILEKAKNYRKDGVYMKAKKKTAVIAIAAVFILGITAFAAVTKWSGGFLSSMNISENQMESLQNSQNGLVSMPTVSDTHDGITVSTAQCLFDGNTFHMSFYVEGYELDKTVEPQLEYINILIDDEIVHNYDWSFFGGIDWTDRKNPKMADGTPVLEDEDGNYIKNYRIADGKMEIDLNCSPYSDSGKRLSGDELKNKDITVIMQNFGDTKGVWTLKWNLGDLESGKKFTINEKLGDTGAIAEDITLYSASAVINYDFPKTEIKVDAYDENGLLYKTTDFAEPPTLVGVKLKDGTVYTDLHNGGSGGYENGNLNKFVARVNFSRIIKVDEIESLLFLKDTNTVPVSEKDCYVINIK